MKTATAFTTRHHETDVCVVGGGMSGLVVALAAARHGAHVVLMHDRPMLGGNASSECRVHICGADRHNRIPHLRETGILEELRMLNLYRNPTSSFSIWDTLLYETVRAEKNITLLLNCSCQAVEKDEIRIAAATGWQMSTQTYRRVTARWFVDCSGDGILGALAGAEFRVGREARRELGESLAPETADENTMGHSIRFQLRRCDTVQQFVPPPWTHTFERCDQLPGGAGGHSGNLVGIGYWWIEAGGEQDSITDSEEIRDELLKIAYGVWDHIKNRCPHCRASAAYLALEWLNFLPARRESRRFMGDHILTQNDVQSGGQFEDTVAYGGWTMDDHDPAGFRAVERKRPPTHFHECPSPYGIPWRALYSRTVPNLLLGGRAISATHMAMSSTRVMGTCTAMGQAVGTGLGLMKRRKLDTPRELCAHIGELQQLLLWDDCYLPGIALDVPEWVRTARLSASCGDPEPVRDGWGRQIGDDPHAWCGGPGDWIACELESPRMVTEVVVAFDSAMHFDPQMSLSNHCVGRCLTSLPDTLAQCFRIEVKQAGEWRLHSRQRNNIHRFVRLPIGKEIEGLRLTLERFHGNCEASRVYTFVCR